MSHSFLFVWMDSFDLNQFFTNKLKIKTSVGDVCLTHTQVKWEMFLQLSM